MKKTAIAFLFSLMICMFFACGSDSSLYRFDGKWEVDLENFFETAVEMTAKKISETKGVCINPQKPEIRSAIQAAVEKHKAEIPIIEFSAKRKAAIITVDNETRTEKVTVIFYSEDTGEMFDAITNEPVFAFTFTEHDEFLITNVGKYIKNYDGPPIPMRRIIEE